MTTWMNYNQFKNKCPYKTNQQTAYSVFHIMMMITRDKDHMGIPIPTLIRDTGEEEDEAASIITIDLLKSIAFNQHSNLL